MYACISEGVTGLTRIVYVSTIWFLADLFYLIDSQESTTSGDIIEEKFLLMKTINWKSNQFVWF